MTTSTALDSAERIRTFVEDTFLATTHKPGITFLLCDDKCYGRVAAPVDNAPTNPSLDDCRLAVSAFVSVAAKERGGLLLIVERDGPESIVESDRNWLRAMREACAAQQVRMLGVWLVMPRLAREIALDEL